MTQTGATSVRELNDQGRTTVTVPERMTAVVLNRHGGTDALEVRNDVPTPLPGDDDVLIAVAAAGMNNTDIWSREGSYGTAGDPAAVGGWRGVPLAFPRIQGGDIAGTLVGAGRNVDVSRLGHRVLVDSAIYDGSSAQARPVGLLGSERDGGFAQYVRVASHRAHDVEASPLSDEELAALPIAYGTAVGMLERAGVLSGERVLVTGAGSGTWSMCSPKAAGSSWRVRSRARRSPPTSAACISTTGASSVHRCGHPSTFASWSTTRGAARSGR
ncbi:alcohol dehydrogenase catalytic domain-containing protein [Haloechinothrix sp. LS1_15]|uniref:alcohol dehydrogenase catalytic domain-containing protein n=1 Tax=Haloechinothrix sp. LS1_15 TaxID=2652248 RepID=UPI00294B1AD5|nr:alcohol dehydrogenase catalytic domain-containing protein [Haloechinothrix sp. LS1_15]